MPDYFLTQRYPTGMEGEHSQYDAMITAIDQAVTTIQQITATIDEK
ncbi:hypothetical protein [Microbacterium flavescens]|nr:hypothetical protein [Microbacterium flavescens]BFF10358.1 hypothetical protein GCM10025699_16610 [Microbacterium flavescens]